VAKSDYLENAILDHVLGSNTFVKPGTVYIAVYTTAPNDAGGGVEVSALGYTRLAVPNTNAYWSPAVGGVKTNAQTLAFGQAVAPWGTLVAAAIFDAASGGNMLYHGALSVPRVVTAGDTVRFMAGEIDLTES